MVTPEPWFEHQIRAFELMLLEGEDHQVGRRSRRLSTRALKARSRTCGEAIRANVTV
jgi:hypothetical protein